MNVNDLYSRMIPYDDDGLPDELRKIGFNEKLVIGGSAEKRFYRIDDTKSSTVDDENKWAVEQKQIKDSCFFGELFESLSSGMSSYVTSLNDLFVTKDSSPYIPRYVSCLVKHCGPAKSMLGYLDMSYCEVVGSRISNLLGVKTTYNISNQMFGNYIDKPVEWENYYYNADSISVDFVPFGWDFENFRDMGARLNTYGNLQDTLEYVKVILGENASNLDINLSQENILQFEKDFCLQYLFRKLVVADCDYTSKNIGVLFNQTNGDFVLAPNFDLEMLFEYEYIRSSKLKQLTDESLIYFHSRFPNLLDSFMSKLEEGLSNGKIKDIMLNTFTNFVNKKPDTTIKYYNDFEWNARIILDAYKSILNSSCPSNNLNDCQTM